MDASSRNVLTLSRLAKAPENLESMDPEPLLKEVLQSRPEFQLPAAQIQIQPSFPRVMGDRWSLSQCLDNLLSNAVKFVAPGVTPVVRLRHERRDNVVRIWVEDNGIGIPTRYQQKSSSRSNDCTMSEKYPGTGVGLAIVQKAVERIGGQVGVESESNQGSRFWIDLQAG
jgi:signal transduction histidine kinase